MSNFAYKIIESLITFPETGKWHKELNLISWNDMEAKYDLRGWSKDRSEMTKGITLSQEELIILKEKLGGLE